MTLEMPQDSYSFAQTRVRLEEIVAQVRKKDVSLEKSLDLLEEGVRLANQCTELIDRADWEAASASGDEEAQGSGSDDLDGDSDGSPNDVASDAAQGEAAHQTGRD